MLENIRADFAAHGRQWGAQGFWAMAVYRFGRWRYQVKPALLRKPLSAAYHALFKYVQVLTGIKLPCEMTLGSGFIIEHASGIVVSGFAPLAATAESAMASSSDLPAWRSPVPRNLATASTWALAPSCWATSGLATMYALEPTPWSSATSRTTALQWECGQ